MMLRPGLSPTAAESSGRPEKVLGIVGETPPNIILRDGPLPPLAPGPRGMGRLDRGRGLHLPSSSPDTRKLVRGEFWT